MAIIPPGDLDAYDWWHLVEPLACAASLDKAHMFSTSYSHKNVIASNLENNGPPALADLGMHMMNDREA